MQIDTTVIAHSVAALLEEGARLGSSLAAGDVVAISGPLGSGKTTFVRGIARGVFDADPVSSPTFTFWHRYEGPTPINHLDLYRVDAPADLAELGLEEAFEPGAITLVEWPERAFSLLPVAHVRVELNGAGDQPRTIRTVRT